MIEIHSFDELKKACELIEPGYCACIYLLDNMWGISDIALDATQITNLNIRHITYLYFVYKDNIVGSGIDCECIVVDRLNDTPNIIGCDRTNLIRYLSQIRPATCVRL